MTVTDDTAARHSEFHLIGKETERGWEQAEDISTLLPSLVRYQENSGVTGERIRERLRQTPLNILERETGLSRHTILRVRQGKRVHPRSLQLLKIALSAPLPSRQPTAFIDLPMLPP